MSLWCVAVCVWVPLCVYLFMRVCVCVSSTHKHTQTSGYTNTHFTMLHTNRINHLLITSHKKRHTTLTIKKNTHLINPYSNETNIPVCTNISAIFFPGGQPSRSNKGRVSAASEGQARSFPEWSTRRGSRGR